MNIHLGPAIGPIFLVVAALGMIADGLQPFLGYAISAKLRGIWLVILGVLLILGL